MWFLKFRPAVSAFRPKNLRESVLLAYFELEVKVKCMIGFTDFTKTILNDEYIPKKCLLTPIKLLFNNNFLCEQLLFPLTHH